MNFDLRSSFLAAVLGIIVALVLAQPALGQRVKPASPDPTTLTRASQNPAIIRAQLELGLIHAREALRRLRTAPGAETAETLEPTIRACYRQIAAAHAGVNMKRHAGKTSGRFVDPTLDTVASQLHKAASQIRTARHVNQSLKPEKPDTVQRIIMHLEATILFAEQAMDLI